MNSQLGCVQEENSSFSMHKLSNIKKAKFMENQYFDGEGNLFTSLIKSNVGTPYDSKISSLRPSPFLLDKSGSTPGGTNVFFKMNTGTPNDDKNQDKVLNHFNSRKLLYPAIQNVNQSKSNQSTMSKIPTPIPVIKGL
jgi:hypothetical protein